MKDKLLSVIIKEVRDKGYHYFPLNLLKPAIGCEGRGNTCVEERLLVWAVENQIFFELMEIGQFAVVKFVRSGT